MRPATRIVARVLGLAVVRLGLGLVVGFAATGIDPGPAWAQEPPEPGEGGDGEDRPPAPHRPPGNLAELFPGEIIDAAGCKKAGGRWFNQGEHEGCVLKGSQHGVWTQYHNEGYALWAAVWKDNVLDGKSVRFHVNGQTKELGTFVKGQRQGPFNGYWDTGALRFSETMVDDKRQGDWKVYHPSGHLEIDSAYKDDELDGPYVGWHRSCHKAKEGAYVAGKETGLWREWTDKGVLLFEGEYKDGKRVGTWKFYHDPSRALVEEGPYVDGKRHGTWTEYFTNGQKFREVEWKDDARVGDLPAACAKLEEAEWIVDFDAREEGCRRGLPPWDTKLLTWSGYYEEGQKKWERQFDENGLQHGLERDWHPTGELLHQGQWERGAPAGEHAWVGLDGKVFGTSSIKGGSGDWQAFYHTGKPRELGMYEQGRKHGRWTAWFDNGNKSAEETWDRGAKNGPMRWWFESGALKVTGEFKNDNRSGIWTAYWSAGRPAWEGPYGEQGERTGEWREYYSDGTPKSIGQMRDDWENGSWIEYYDNGEKSGEGTYKDGKRQGKWLLWWKTGELWREANYENGVEVGTGNDECMQAGGEWVNLPEERVTGCMLCRWDAKADDEKEEMVGLDSAGAIGQQGSPEDKTTPQGEVKPADKPPAGDANGKPGEVAPKPPGPGTPPKPAEVDPAGKVRQDPERDWIFWHANGKKEKQGRFHDGNEDGLWTFWYEDGSKRLEGTFKEGVEHGVWSGWYQNGPKKFEGSFADGKETGEWTTYSADGKVRSVGKYEAGQKVGRWVWYHPNGAKREEGDFAANEEAGTWTAFYPSGKKSGEGGYKAGKREGLWTWWREDGAVWRTATYKDGKEATP